MYSFCSQSGCPDGAWPNAGLRDLNGTLYGTTYQGGSNQQGTVFALDPKTGVETVLYSFGGGDNDGALPTDRPKILNGILYGTTLRGGKNGQGTVFAVDLQTGAETTFALDGIGAEPFGGLIGGTRELYGATVMGGSECGSAGCGTVFALDPETGAETTLFVFDETDGQNPIGRLLHVNPMIYGTTNQGGEFFDNGTVFAFDPRSGAETVLHAFGPSPDGENPVGHLIDVNGILYGTTLSGGRYGDGTVFAVETNGGTERILHSFSNHNDGQEPHAGLIDVSGTLYGTTTYGGAYGGGTVYSLNPSTGAEGIVYEFGSGVDASNPCGDLNVVKGKLYGTTWAGGAYGWGTIFSIALSTDDSLPKRLLHSRPSPQAHPPQLRPSSSCEIGN